MVLRNATTGFFKLNGKSIEKYYAACVKYYAACVFMDNTPEVK